MSHPVTDYLDPLRQSFGATWHNTERAIQSLMQHIQRQNQQIQNLEGNTHALERQIQQKSEIIKTLEVRISELENHVNAKDKELVEVKNNSFKLQTGITHFASRCVDLQKHISEAQANHQSASNEVTSLQAKLVEAEKRAAAAGGERREGDSFSHYLSEEQLKKMETALKKELEARNDLVRRAAWDAVQPLRNGYLTSLARVKELEEQLQKLQSREDVVTHASAVNSDANGEGPSSSIPSHIVSGTYRPRPPALPGNDSHVAPEAYSAVIITPLPLPHPSQTNPPPPFIHDVIDLTGVDAFPDATEDGPPVVESAAQGLKRKRVDSDDAELPPSEMHAIQSKAHRPAQDNSQPSDFNR